MTEKKEKKRTVVSIYGQQYTIVGAESTIYIKQVAASVDRKMNEIKKLNPYLDTTRLAVLTAVNVVDENMKLNEKLEKLMKQKEEEERNV